MCAPSFALAGFVRLLFSQVSYIHHTLIVKQANLVLDESFVDVEQFAAPYGHQVDVSPIDIFIAINYDVRNIVSTLRRLPTRRVENVFDIPAPPVERFHPLTSVP